MRMHFSSILWWALYYYLNPETFTPGIQKHVLACPHFSIPYDFSYWTLLRDKQHFALLSCFAMRPKVESELSLLLFHLLCISGLIPPIWSKWRNPIRHRGIFSAAEIAYTFSTSIKRAHICLTMDAFGSWAEECKLIATFIGLLLRHYLLLLW